MQRILVCCLISLLILSSCKFQDNVSSTPQTPGTGDTSIKVVAPNGGETLAEGSSYQIQWTGTGSLLVRIQYSADNGTSWSLIKDSLKNTGLYNWFPVPNTVSSQCLVQVSSLDGVSSGRSAKIFSIVKNSNKSLRITSPIGGETWQAGTSAQVTWYSSGIDSVKIDYTIDNGQSWTVITNSMKNTGIYYWQPIPNTPTTLAKVRIRDAQDGVTSTESPNPFQILPEKTVKVLSPKGGEQWYAGSSNNIIWQSTNIANVKIEYTINGGATWSTIVASTPSTGVYSWNSIPNVSSLQCKVRISDASNGIPSAVSDNNFTINTPGNKLIAVTSPNGGEKWAAGTTQTITWSASGITNVKIEYTINNGITWNIITSSTPSTGFYTWVQVPNTPSTNCKVRISDEQGSPSDDSDNLFSITPAPSIVVNSPNGGEVWTSGTSQKIKYTSVNIPNVKIEFTTDGGANWTTITNSTPSIGEYVWDNIPNVNSYQCKVKISDAMFGSPSGISNNNFTITNQVIKSITITSPIGGEVWEASTSKTITWSAVGVGNVKLEITTNNGLTWSTIENSIPNTGSYSWNVPNTQSTQCKIRVSDIGGSPSSESPNTFTIKPAASITLISPNGNEVIRAGQAYNITWKVVGIDNVKIEYTANSSSNLVEWKTIVASTPAAAGSYAFGFPQPSSDCRVRISEAVSGSPTATSAGTFTVLPKTSITVVSPNGGESWILGQTYEIQWKSVNVANVKIEYTLNNGADGWHTIVENLPNGELYNWKVPTDLQLPTGQNFVGSSLCKIRVSEYNAANPTVVGASDESDDVFSIFSKIIRVVTPDGGEIWKKQATQRIIWMAAGVNNVKIEYTLDNGNRWTTIVDNYPNYGAYDWFTPNVVSSLGKIRISDVNDPTFSDETNGYFSLVAELPFINIEKPQLNDTLHVGIPSNIEWYNSDNIYTVKLEYGYYNGTDTVWAVIKNSVDSPGNQRNVYAWTVPNTPSNYVRIRISGIAIIDPNQNTVRPMRTYSANFIIR